MTHFARLSPSVDVWIEGDPAHTLTECKGIGETARMVLHDSALNFDSVRIHVPLIATTS